MYRLLFDLVFRRLDAETAHRIGFALIRLGGAARGLARLLGAPDPVLRTRIWDLDLPGPLGLAAGFDKDGHGPAALGALGFAFVEVGTVTAVAQPGNPRPRLFRLPADQAVVNRMGFNNGGAAALGTRLAGRRDGTVVGVNIGKTRAVAEADAVADYVASTTAVAGVADYLAVNVSSPNTPGLRDLQAVDQLRPLLTAVRAALDSGSARRVPLLVKIAPDLADEDVDAVADLALDLDLDGIIATNTTISRDGLRTDPATVAALGAGGLSGAPLAERSLAVLRRLRGRVGGRVPLVAVGGVSTGADAYARIRAGASLVQGYTAFIYGGPLWPRRVQRELAGLLRRDGFTSVADAVGADCR